MNVEVLTVNLRRLWCVAACVFGYVVTVLLWAPPLAVCVWPAGVLALTLAVYGARCGLYAMRGGLLDKTLGTLALLLCAAFVIVPIVLLVTARFR